MADREKVMQWLETCANGCEDGCPYEYKNLVYRVECKADLMSDALELLKEQKPRVMTLDELIEIYIEFKGNAYLVRLTMFDLQKIIMYMDDGICRLWAGKPTYEQMEAVKWE